jgi:hypothetical protein
VGDEDDGLAQLTLQPQQLLLQALAHHRVDGAERLVHQQHRRVGGERAGHPDALLLAARQLRRVAPGHLRTQLDGLHQLGRAPARLGLAPAEKQRDGGDVVADGAVREQPGLLDHVADAAAQVGGVDGADVAPVDLDGARGDVDHSVDHAEGGGLAATRWTDEDRDLPGVHGEVQVLDRHRAVREALGDAPELDHEETPVLIGDHRPVTAWARG